MRFPISAALGLVLVTVSLQLPSRAADDYKPGPDSQPQAGVPKGELIKGQYTVREKSVFPGTARDYTIYLPPGWDKNKPAPFMVFQDGVIYQAPTVFDNLIAKKEIPPLIGIFIRPGVVPAANANALPRFNRSYEYDSVTDTYSRFLIDEFLPEIAKKHGLKLSEKGDDTAIAGNSSGGICAFMVAWHRPDRFRRVFTGVGTYVGIHGADQLPVLVRKMEPKPLRVYLQSGTGDNNLYCGDWWMANQTMERSLTWAGYDVSHTWGEGGHNAKHATAIFPEALKWLWRGWPEEGLRTNPTNASKWKGYEVLGDNSKWEDASDGHHFNQAHYLASDAKGTVYISREASNGASGQGIYKTSDSGKLVLVTDKLLAPSGIAIDADGNPIVACLDPKDKQTPVVQKVEEGGDINTVISLSKDAEFVHGLAVSRPTGSIYLASNALEIQHVTLAGKIVGTGHSQPSPTDHFALSPDQTLLYFTGWGYHYVGSFQVQKDGTLINGQKYFQLEEDEDGRTEARGLCVDAEGRLYVATSRGIQVCDQAGRVNFIISTPAQPFDVCFGGKDLSELFIACGDKIYKRPMKVHGIVSGQMAPIKPTAPHL